MGCHFPTQDIRLASAVHLRPLRRSWWRPRRVGCAWEIAKAASKLRRAAVLELFCESESQLASSAFVGQ
jgi:hypothetical protein